MIQDFEKLGIFYLGRVRDAATGESTQEPLLYDARDLTTHAVIVGMTGSGKTGLALSLLEEAAIDGVPAIAIDPKGDLGNLLLTFPQLRPEDFRPWVDEGDAQRKGLTLDALAEQTAEAWRKGLAEWAQDASRVERFRSAVDLAIYTPGSSAGLPLSVLRSLSAPPAALAGDADALRERIMAAVSGLLTLLDLEADPIRGREHILLSKLVERAWSEGRDLDLSALIRDVQSPPFQQVGVLDLDTFFPPKDRAELSLALNNLLASPGFAAWMEGEPLDIARLLWTPEGKPRISILSIAHLSDPERMFFVTLLMNEIVAWMRGQSGTSSLRALIYMDEVFGYLPPVANPPSKTPMLTLFKQARAFGLGVVVATQNPVDLDYKGLANAGTWFLGRLQTERDKARVLEGLEGASAVAGKSFDRARFEEILSRLGNRVFLMNNVHEDLPVLFETRWAMSYLRGPLTKIQIQQLMAGRKSASPEVQAAPAAANITGTSLSSAQAPGTQRPLVPADIPEKFLPWRGAAGNGESLVYQPAVFGSSRLHYVQAKAGVDAWDAIALLAPLQPDGDGVSRETAVTIDPDSAELEQGPDSRATFAPLPSAATRPRSYGSWRNSLEDYLYRTRALLLFRCPALKLVSTDGESEGDFRVRVQQGFREKRDADVEKLRQRYAPKVAQLRERVRTAEHRVQRESGQFEQQKMQTAISLGASVLGALFGRRGVGIGTLGRATTAVRGAGRAAREREDIGMAEENLQALQQRQAELEAEFQEAVSRLGEEVAPEELTIEPIQVRPRKADITVERLSLPGRLPGWHRTDPRGPPTADAASDQEQFARLRWRGTRNVERGTEI